VQEQYNGSGKTSTKGAVPPLADRCIKRRDIEGILQPGNWMVEERNRSRDEKSASTHSRLSLYFTLRGRQHSWPGQSSRYILRNSPPFKASYPWRRTRNQ